MTVVVSYNVHRCIGADGQHDPGRVASVIREMRPDVVALQELSTRDGVSPDDVDQVRYLAEACGLEAVPGPTIVDGRGSIGNAVLTRLPVRRVDSLDLSVPGREPRSALDVGLDGESGPLRLLATHLGLSRRERRTQLRRLGEWIDGEAAGDEALLVVGDMNEWRPGPSPLSLLHERLGRQRRIRTFPARRPVLSLDRIWVRPRELLRELAAHTTALSRVASDHLPLRAVLGASAETGDAGAECG